MQLSNLRWPLVLALGCLALARPIVRIVEDQQDMENHAIIPIGITAAVTVVWVLIVGLSRVPQPVETLVATGLTYGVLSIVLSGILSPILLGHLDGPLAHPVGIVPDLMVNAVWGLIAGALAQGLRRIRS